MEKLCSHCLQRCLQGSLPKSTLHQLKLHMKFFSTSTSVRLNRESMKAWQIHQYGGNENLMLSSLVRIPKVQDPTDILVQVHAASINPIDCEMRGNEFD